MQNMWRLQQQWKRALERRRGAEKAPLQATRRQLLLDLLPLQEHIFMPIQYRSEMAPCQLNSKLGLTLGLLR